MENVKKIIRCAKCNYFDAKQNCSHCQKCEKHELDQFLNDANNQLLKSFKSLSGNN